VDDRAWASAAARREAADSSHALEASFPIVAPEASFPIVAPLARRGYRAARVTTASVLTGYAAVIAINELWGPGRQHLWVFVVCFVAVFALQMVHSISGARKSPRRVRLLTLSAQAVPTYLPLIWMAPWGSMAGFLAGSVLLLTTGWIRWSLYAGVGASILPSALAWHTTPDNVVWLIESNLLTGLVVYCVSSLATMVVDAHAAREELARMAVAREQLRVERELHDVLGTSLARVAHKCEAAASLLARAPARAKEDLAEVLQVVRQELVEVRKTARGYRRMSLGAEAETARATLTSAGVEAIVVISDTPLPPDVDSLLANVLRGVAASLLVLGPGRGCLIEVGELNGVARLRVVIDDTEPAPDLEAMRTRMDAAGGRLSVDVDDDGRFQLTAEVPTSGASRPPQGLGAPGPQRPLPAPPSVSLGRHALTPHTAMVITMVVLTAYALVTAVYVLSSGVTYLGLARLAICLGIVFSLQVAHSSGGTVRRSPHVRAFLLSIQAVATYLPFLWLGQQWGAMAGFLAGAFLLTVAEPWCWILYGSVAGSVVPILWLMGLPVISIVYGCVFTLLTGLIVYSISSLQALVGEAHAARGPLIRMAVVQERLRIARDLHDLLSYNLSAISLKTELTYRLLPGSADRAHDELADVLTLTRRTLADVDNAASGQPHVSLGIDGESAQSTLSASGIDGSVEISCGPLPYEVESVLAIALREAAANILRHSKARAYRIEAARQGATVSLHVANDGAGYEVKTGSDLGGAGLHNLDTRLRGVGGTLTAGLDRQGWFHLRAVVPVHSAGQQEH